MNKKNIYTIDDRFQLLLRAIWTKKEAKIYMNLSDRRSQHYFKLLPKRKNLNSKDILRDDFLSLFETNKDKEIEMLSKGR